MQKKRSPIPKPTIRHPDRKKEAERVACRGAGDILWALYGDALVSQMDAEIMGEQLDAIAASKALADQEGIGVIDNEQFR